jgi:virginiamycin B lyase
MQNKQTRSVLALALGWALCAPAFALDITVTSNSGKPLASVMVRAQSSTLSAPANWHGKTGDRTSGTVQPEYTWFTNTSGRLSKTAPYPELRLQLRSPGYQTLSLEKVAGNARLNLKLTPETDPAALAASRPANAWFSQLELGDETLKKHFALQCAFCHQQGNAFLRAERSAEQWDEVIARMITYGSRLSSEAQDSLPQRLSEGYRHLREHPEKIPAGTPWPGNLNDVTITEWPIGDAMSQMHDLLTHSNGKVYVGDNLKDDLIEIDPVTGEYSIYKLPRSPDDKPGGLLGARLRAFPQHETYVGLHSFAESPVDGHIFMTCSVQRRLIEFAP